MDEIKEEVEKQLSDAKRFILGRPNFTLARYAQILREKGYKIERSAEDEQAVVIQFFLVMLEKYGEDWKDKICSYFEQEEKQKV